MKDMKSDMAGGAVVLAAMSLMRDFDVTCEVHGYVPACENMPSDRAYRLGDVLRGLDGPQVEVVNTDAEGRLIMADAISYARQKGCTELIDLATLTGACVVALGPDLAGVMGSEARVDAFHAAAEQAGEATWPMPLPTALEEQLKSQVADCKNAGGRYGGALTAGLFLKKFVKDTDWIHVDIAGPAFLDKPKPGRAAGGTGFGVASLLAYLTRETEETS
jgi:leucyl aminopeptidase